MNRQETSIGNGLRWLDGLGAPRRPRRVRGLRAALRPGGRPGGTVPARRGPRPGGGALESAGYEAVFSRPWSIPAISPPLGGRAAARGWESGGGGAAWRRPPRAVKRRERRQRLIGVDTAKLTEGEIAVILNELRAGFESGALKPSAVKTWPLDDAVKAYEAVAAGDISAKHILNPKRA
jgi:hypothetical protein